MPRLAQIIAVEKQTKNNTNREITDAYHAVQKPDPFFGISKTYRPKDEENGDKLPPENKKVQVKTEDVLQKTGEILTKLFDITATKDIANCSAKADVVVDGKVIASGLPVTYLLFLEKQLVDVRTLVAKLPTLDPAETWAYDQGQDCFASEPAESHRSKKIKRTLTLAAATDKHPAQVQVFDEDETVGFWKVIKYSGALPAKRANAILERVDTLIKAVKFAREEANGTEAKDQRVGGAIFGYLFQK